MDPCCWTPKFWRSLGVKVFLGLKSEFRDTSTPAAKIHLLLKQE